MSKRAAAHLVFDAICLVITFAQRITTLRPPTSAKASEQVIRDSLTAAAMITLHRRIPQQSRAFEVGHQRSCIIGLEDAPISPGGPHGVLIGDLGSSHEADQMLVVYRSSLLPTGRNKREQDARKLMVRTFQSFPSRGPHTSALLPSPLVEARCRTAARLSRVSLLRPA